MRGRIPAVDGEAMPGAVEQALIIVRPAARAAARMALRIFIDCSFLSGRTAAGRQRRITLWKRGLAVFLLSSCLPAASRRCSAR